MEQHLEDLGRRKMQGLPGQQHLAPHLAVGRPSAVPPVPELDQPATLDAGTEDKDNVRDLLVTLPNGSPGLLTSVDQGTCRW